MTGLAQLDEGKNKVLDINSLMTAFEDYSKKAAEGSIGVPLAYYVKPITAMQLAQMWVEKYYPKEYVTAAGVDS